MVPKVSQSRDIGFAQPEQLEQEMPCFGELQTGVAASSGLPKVHRRCTKRGHVDQGWH